MEKANYESRPRRGGLGTGTGILASAFDDHEADDRLSDKRWNLEMELWEHERFGGMYHQAFSLFLLFWRIRTSAYTRYQHRSYSAGFTAATMDISSSSSFSATTSSTTTSLHSSLSQKGWCKQISNRPRGSAHLQSPRPPSTPEELSPLVIPSIPPPYVSSQRRRLLLLHTSNTSRRRKLPHLIYC